MRDAKEKKRNEKRTRAERERQGRTVNFRYGTPRKAGSPVGAIKRPVCRLLLPRMTPSSCSPPVPRLPFSSLWLENGLENCARRDGGCCPSQRYPLKFVGHHDCGNAKEKKRVFDSVSLPPLVKSTPTSLIGCSSHRNCRCSPTRNHASRIYGLMSSVSFSSSSASFIVIRARIRVLSSLERHGRSGAFSFFIFVL